MSYNPSPTEPMFDSLRYCLRCGMPSSEAEITFDELGMCNICVSSEQKMHINWKERDRILRDILAEYRGKGDYDCIVPISGGKDSMFQLYVLTQVHALKPLAVTFSHNWFSPTGLKNLQTTIETFKVDHVMFTPNRDLVNRIARRSLEMIGDSCWHCHAGIGAFPLQMAVRYRIPLIIWGESAAEMSGAATYEKPVAYDRDYFTKVSSKFTAEEYACEYLPLRDLAPFRLPSYEAIEDVGVRGIYLGDYLFWDHERQTEFLRDRYGWQEDTVPGTFKCYKSVECRMPGVHDFTKFLKRGFGRATDHAAQDVRAGLLTREDAFSLIREHDPVEPDGLDYYLEITGYSRDEFYAIMDRKREEAGFVTRAEIDAALADARRRRSGPVS